MSGPIYNAGWQRWGPGSEKDGHARLFYCYAVLAGLALLCLNAAPVRGAGIRMVESPDDPYSIPRPARDARHVPVDKSFFFKLVIVDAGEDEFDRESLRVRLESEKEEPLVLVGEAGRPAEGVDGWVRDGSVTGLPALALYLDPGQRLEPGTKYKVVINVHSEQGEEFMRSDPYYPSSAMRFRALAGAERMQEAGPDRWMFTTADEPATHRVTMTLNRDAGSVHWHGKFFSGFCNVQFCTQEEI